jgi:hypothetical protein
MWGCSRVLATAERTPLRGASLQGRRRLCVGLGWSEDHPGCVGVHFWHSEKSHFMAGDLPHGLPIILKHDLVALGIEGICNHCLLMLLDTWIAGSCWRLRNAHDRHCSHVPGRENPPSLKQHDMIGSLRCVSWLGRSVRKPCSYCEGGMPTHHCRWLFLNEKFMSSQSRAEQ